MAARRVVLILGAPLMYLMYIQPVERRGRGKTVCARGANRAASAGRSASPLAA
jgi:hypothetical protein